MNTSKQTTTQSLTVNCESPTIRCESPNIRCESPVYMPSPNASTGSPTYYRSGTPQTFDGTPPCTPHAERYFNNENENDNEAAYLHGAAANHEFTDLEKDESKNASPITLAAAVTILIIGVPSIIILINYKSEKNINITPELYTPNAEDNNEIKSIAESLILEQGSEIKTEKNSSDETLLEKAEDQNSIKPCLLYTSPSPRDS